MWYLILSIILFSTNAFAQGAGVGSAPGVGLQDEGITQGRVQIVDCVGTSITCTKTGATGVITIGSSGGGGSPSWGGRLTLSTGTPVMITDVSNSISILYTPYRHDFVAISNGVTFTNTQFAELTNTTTNATVNPAAVVANSNYDLFVWNDAGTLRLGRGPPWTSGTARGVGAGTTELTRLQGVLVNANAITNGAAALFGTYVGTVRSDAAATIDWELGGVALGGDPGFLYVWNMYNRIDVEIKVTDSTGFWDYAVLATWRSSNGSDSNRVSYVIGIAEDKVVAVHIRNAISVAGAAVPYIGIGLDSTVAKDSVATFGTNSFGPRMARSSSVLLGAHFYQAIELNNPFGASTARFYGQVILAFAEGALFVEGRF